MWYGDLKPYKAHKFRHDYWYQVRAAAGETCSSKRAPKLAHGASGSTALRPRRRHLPLPRRNPAAAAAGLPQVPKKPRATVVLIHGCAHSGYNYWPQVQAERPCPLSA